MELKVIREGKYDIEFELSGGDHTLCNALREALVANEDVEVAAYSVENPLLGSPRMLVKTKELPLPQKGQKLLPLEAVKGVAEKREKQLRKAGIKSANALAKADAEKLAEKTDIPLATVQELIAEASKLEFWKESTARKVIKKSLKALAKEFKGAKIGRV